MTESEIIQSCQRGDRVAFKTLVERYAPMLKGVCIRYMKDEFSSEDLLQECFITIFRNIEGYRHEGAFEGWMRKIAVRCALQELRKKKNVVYLEHNNPELEKIKVSAEIELELAEEDILKMINRLPDHYRIVFNMYVIEGYTHSEIGELLDIGESTSRTKLTRARKKIQSIYEQMTTDGISTNIKKTKLLQ